MAEAFEKREVLGEPALTSLPVGCKHPELDRCDVVKLGGSVITDKSDKYRLNSENVEMVAATVAEGLEQLQHPLILVLGGGSFGNQAPKDYGLEDGKGSWQSVDLAKMTTVMFDMLTKVSAIFQQYKVPVYPFQTSALMHIVDGHPHLNGAPVIEAIKLGCIPLICGDLVFDDQQNFQIFSSDNIPYALADSVPLRSVLYYSNVKGVHHPQGTTNVIETVNHKNFTEVLDSTGPSEQPDVTGGMRNKFRLMGKLANKGIKSEVMHFAEFRHFLLSLDAKRRFGTQIIPFDEKVHIC